MIGAAVARRNLRRAFRALESHDLDAFLSGWSDDAVFAYPGDLQVSGEHRGRAEVRRFFEGWLEQFPSARFDIRAIALARPWDLAGTNVAMVESRFTATTREGREVGAEVVTVVRLRRGRVVHVRDYIFDTGHTLETSWGEARATPAAGQPG